MRARILGVIACLWLLTGAGPAALAAQEAPEIGPAAPAMTPAFPVYGSEIVVSALDNEQNLPRAAYNSKHDEYLVVWHNKWGGGNRDIYAQRVSGSGKLLSWFTVTAGPTSRAQPDVAYDPVHDRYLVVWVRDANGDGSNWDVWGRLVDWNAPGSYAEFRICDWTTKQWNPRVAYAGTQQEFMVVWWTEHPTLPGYTSGRRIRPDGEMPWGPFLISSHLTQNRVGPGIAYNQARNEYLVTYHNGVDIFGARLAGDGTLIGGGEFGIAGWPDAETNPAVAACREFDRYLVTWESNQGGNKNLYARLVLGDGSPAAVFQIWETSAAEIYGDVACDQSGRQFLVAWQQQYSSTSGPFGVWGRFVRPDGFMGPSFGVVAPTPPGYRDRTRPSVTGGLMKFLVLWEHDREDTSYQDIHGRFITPFAAFLPLASR